ncbi:MAG TPA: hypothetical protein DCS21_04920 [Gammaproteobacteria bacterium]|nr:hypothetical protein [Gammaproteobacteria bacterium]
MLVSIIRVKGAHDTWWNDVVNLLSGRGVRRGPPEQLAVNQSIQALKTTLAASVTDVSQVSISVAISHDGAGENRAATAVAFANPEETIALPKEPITPEGLNADATNPN